VVEAVVATVVGVAAAIILVDDIITVEAEEIMVVELVGGTAFPAVVVEEGHYLEWGAQVIRPWEEAMVALEEIEIIGTATLAIVIPPVLEAMPTWQALFQAIQRAVLRVGDTRVVDPCQIIITMISG
jgi:hypothetical protein